MNGTMLMCLLIECHQKLHLITGSQVREITAIGQRVHVEEDALFSPTSLALILVENESILYNKQKHTVNCEYQIHVFSSVTGSMTIRLTST